MQFRSFVKKVSLASRCSSSFDFHALISVKSKRESIRLFLFLTVVLSLGWLTACKQIEKLRRTATDSGDSEVVLRLHGSNTIGAEFAPALVEAFLKKKGATGIKRIPGAPEEMMIEAVLPGDSAVKRIEIKAHGSDTAVKSLINGECDIGMLSRKMKADEVDQLSKLGDMKARGNENVIALDGIAVIVNKSNSVRELSLKQIAQLFTGEIKDWEEIKSDTTSGKSGKVNIYARDDKSGTFDTFKNLVLGKEKKLVGTAKRFEDSKALSDEVSADPNGIGFVGLPYIGSSTAVSVFEEGVQPLKPAARTIQTREYLLHRELYFYLPQTTQNKLARELVAFALADEGQEVAQEVGFISQKIEAAKPDSSPEPDEKRTDLPAELVKIKESATEFPTRFYFQTGGKQLDNKSLDDFDRIVKFLEKQSAKDIILVGYSDSIGSDQQNESLSKDRAKAVEQEFIKVGLKPTQITGFGKANPIAGNDKPDGREKTDASKFITSNFHIIKLGGNKMPTGDEIDTWIRQKDTNSEGKEIRLLQDKYEISERVGEGGMGKVYRGRDRNLKRQVAIKEFSPSQHFDIDRETWQELETAFQREATLLANLKHESLPIVFEIFTENYKHYLVMEFVEGDDLKKRAKELREKYDGQFPVKKVRKWAEDLLEVLIYLHDRESPIFHRDIKPENLKLRNDKILLLDFGLAKGSAGNVSFSSMTDRTTYGFTARYAPVEQIRGEKTTAQTDLYALSATLYYLLTGVEPVDARTREKTIRNGEPDPLRSAKGLRPETDNAFARIIIQGLAVEAQNRPKSAREMLDILRSEEAAAGSEFENKTLPFIMPSPTIISSAPPETVHLPSPPPSFKPHPLVSVEPIAKPSRWKRIILVFVGGAVLCVAAVAAVVLLFPLIFPQNDTNVNTNQPLTAGSGREKRLLSEQKLYEFPGRRNATGTLPKGAKVQVDDSRQEPSGEFSIKVKSGSKEGWIICEKKEGEDCFASE